MEKNLLAPGHAMCAGCGQSIAARIVVNEAGPETIIVNATGCLEVSTSLLPTSSWEVPWIHSLFENTAAVAAGIEAALKHLNKIDSIKVIAQAGDGGTADIGLQALSGMWERGHDVLYVCYDNGAYMNTGVQRSSLTPYCASTTTSPPGECSIGNPFREKDMVKIAAAHHIPYAATASVGFPRDLRRKVKKALGIRGPKYLQILVPCPLGWRHETKYTYKIGRLAVDTGLLPLVEYEEGELASVRKIKEPKKVEEYFKLQRRFSHLLKDTEEAKRELEKVQLYADRNIEYYDLLLK
ncbi:MAG: pyruvate ferredoxin oxidoreductase [Candidatus Syntrophonatronum acetioxidans]|uniref:Pyruvate ferredoxin oxidoreductase n=1 Tax=Candidatus Syntrophonatronum acetioxidans TaxID=1795816 RepID=A0A424YD11_9FIRM|nr:MAG: pyruvate ferredoxin oxidoreductase [Candidatus Syntrophonatronum acetioxidans]